MKSQKKRIRILLSYDGSLFKGWQRQKSTPETIQQHLEKALSQIFNQAIKVIGAGRTDAGVHAFCQTAHFDLPISKKIHRHFVRSLNALTPPTLCCHQAWLAPLDFHAQMSATRRSYRYFILNTQTPSAFKVHQALWYPHPIQFENLQKMAQQIKKEVNFKSFQNKGTITATTHRHIFEAQWFWLKPKVLIFHICANSFLKQMVRNLIGTQLHLMSKKDPVKCLKLIFQQEDRQTAFQTAPACGLFLHHVSYPLILDRKCKKT